MAWDINEEYEDPLERAWAEAAKGKSKKQTGWACRCGIADYFLHATHCRFGGEGAPWRVSKEQGIVIVQVGDTS